MDKRRDVFQAIADPTRREIISLLAGKSLNLNAIATHFNHSRPTISQHVKILEECGLLVITKIGRERQCKVKPDSLDEVSDWIAKFRQYWESKMDDLEQYIDQIQK